jgi:putative membrane protein
MTKFLLRWAVNAAAVFAAFSLLSDGITRENQGWMAIIWVAFILGLLNAIVRPLLKFLTCPLIILTLGLFTLVINTIIFWLAGVVGYWFGVGYTVDGFWTAFLGGLIVSIVSVLLSMFVKDGKKD